MVDGINYFAGCCNFECGWSGQISNCKILDGLAILCPNCGQLVGVFAEDTGNLFDDGEITILDL